MATKLKIRHILDGSIITQDKVLQRWPYVIFLACLAILLIANNYVSEKIIRETNSLNRELKELQTEHLATLSEYLRKSQQSEIAKRLNEVGIKESVVPPKRIKVKRKK
ncbi:MAG: FtsL-like putative cell division protein [Bacteroidales bacterium]|nr:FtsL-like putative cell division protein [Bacteroidales bacterium]